MTRDHGCDLLASEAVRAALDPRFALRALPPARARGLAEPVAIFAIEGFDLDRAPGDAAGGARIG
jgi:class 3 adenylate cyclase